MGMERRTRAKTRVWAARTATVAVLCAGLAAPLSATAADQQVETGRQLALDNCAKCHAIGRSGESPHEEAPPFRRLHSRYPVEDLAEALAEGIAVGHKDMPPFAFEPVQIKALLAYLKSLERPLRN